MKKKKILVVSNMYPDDKHPSYGIFVKKFCDQLDSLNMEYSLCVMHKADHKIGKIIKYSFFYIRSFFKTLLGAYDLIYIHYPSFSGATVNLANIFRRNIIYTNLHGSDVVPENSTHVRLQKYTRKLIAKSEKIIVPSEYFKNLVSDKYGIEKKIIYIYPSGGVDKSVFFKKDKLMVNEFNNRFGIKEGLPVIGMAGRISKDKGWDTFVESIDQLSINANYVIIGSGIEERILEGKIQESSKNIIWIRKLLPQNELATFYNVCDFLVFPTKRAGESLGLVALEAMACGTPVIASDYASLKYIVVDGFNGIKFEKGNSYELSKAIERALKFSKEEKDVLVSGAVETASEYSEEAIKKSLINIFQS